MVKGGGFFGGRRWFLILYMSYQFLRSDYTVEISLCKAKRALFYSCYSTEKAKLEALLGDHFKMS